MARAGAREGPFLSVSLRIVDRSFWVEFVRKKRVKKNPRSLSGCEGRSEEGAPQFGGPHPSRISPRGRRSPPTIDATTPSHPEARTTEPTVDIDEKAERIGRREA
jgi:hypothetical protein